MYLYRNHFDEGNKEFEAFDCYCQLDDITLLWRAVESLMTSAFYEKTVIKFNRQTDFKDLHMWKPDVRCLPCVHDPSWNCHWQSLFHSKLISFGFGVGFLTTIFHSFELGCFSQLYFSHNLLIYKMRNQTMSTPEDTSLFCVPVTLLLVLLL